jgi:hypothetical protein
MQDDERFLALHEARAHDKLVVYGISGNHTIVFGSWFNVYLDACIHLCVCAYGYLVVFYHVTLMPRLCCTRTYVRAIARDTH